MIIAYNINRAKKFYKEVDSKKKKKDSSHRHCCLGIRKVTQ